MAEVKDIILDEDDDLKIINGDFVVSESDIQHIDLLLNTYIGDWKQSPTTGLGTESYLSSPNTDEVLRRDISVQLKADGYQVIEILIDKTNADNLKITPRAIRTRK